MALSEWSSFFSAEVSAAATLAGLVTVAISINLSRILEVDHLPARAAEALVVLIIPLAICSFALFPGLSERTLGSLAFVFGCVSLGLGGRNQWKWRTAIGSVEIERQIIGGLARLVATLPIIIGGALLLLQAPAGVGWLASGVVITLITSVLNAWVLLVEIIR
jgi:hypothetical protein